MRVLPFALALWFCVVPACAEIGDPDDDPVDPIDAAFTVGPAAAACLPDVASDDARGLLALVNDPEVSAAELDDAGRSAAVAARIVLARPIADLAALDRIPRVGPYACRTLRTYACEVRGRCEPELALWTWNIEHFPLSDRAVDEVAGVLADPAGPELVGFEEVDSIAAFDQLMADLPGWDGLLGETGFDTRVALAYRPDRLRLVAREDLFPDDSSRFPRPPLAVTFEVQGRVASGRLTVVVVHLKAMVDAASEERRRQAVIALEAWMDQRRQAGDGAIVAIGDWNDDVDDPPNDNVFAPFLDRPDRYAALTLAVAGRHEFSYIPFHRLIDHLVATQEAAAGFPAAAVDVVPLETTIADYLHVVSDHRPVRARLVPILPAP